MEKVIVLKNIGKLYTAPDDNPMRGNDLDNLYVMEDIDIIIENDKIFYIGKDPERFLIDRDFEIIDLNGKTVLPGFIDAHTHLVFYGSRHKEFYMRFKGASYLEILKSGGGINFSVESLRKASDEEIIQNCLFFLKQIFMAGTTVLEVKSGYGLSYEHEKRILKIIDKLNRLQPVELIPTFLGAHIYPEDMSKDRYFDLLLNKMIPEFREYTSRCDVFIEDGAYSIDDAEKIFRTAKKYDYDIVAHLNQINDLGGVPLALDYGVKSLDHLEKLSEKDAEKLAASDTVGVFLPIAEFMLNHKEPGKFNLLKGENGLVALATDFNPGSAPIFSIPILMFFAVFRYKISFSEIFHSVTINPAFSLGINERVGSIKVGKQADLLVMEDFDIETLPYFTGANLFHFIIKKGKIYNASVVMHSDF